MKLYIGIQKEVIPLLCHGPKWDWMKDSFINKCVTLATTYR